MDLARSKSRLLVVDGDPKSLRVLDVSLKKAGFEVATATSGREAMALLEASVPDLIISDTDLAETDGFELCRRIKASPEWAKIPFLFVSSRKSIEDKIRGLELGVDDYLSKPIYIKEIGIRVRTALQRAERERMESRREGRTRFAGDLSDVGVVDLVQTIELNRKSGIIHIVNRDNRRGSIFFRDGKVVDAEVGRLSGANAVYRLFSWFDGQFAVEFKHIRRHDVVDTPTAQLLMEGMRRLDESTRLLESLPSSRAVLEVDCRVLAEELAELPDEVNSVLRLCDGTRILQEVVEDSDHADLEALTILSRLFAEQVLFAREPPNRAGESEPGERLAHWLSEGLGGNGATADDSNAPLDFSSPLEAIADGVAKGSPPRGGGNTLKLPAMLSSDAPRKTAEAWGAIGSAAVPDEEDPAPEPSQTGSPRAGGTLKGVPVDSLFTGPADSTADQGSAGHSTRTASAVASLEDLFGPGDGRPARTAGSVERLPSDDSAVCEATSPGDGTVARAVRPERNTREYGSFEEAAATLVDEMVSGSRRTPRPGNPAEPAKSLEQPLSPAIAPAADAAPLVEPERSAEMATPAEPSADAGESGDQEAPASLSEPVAELSLLPTAPEAEDATSSADELSSAQTSAVRRLWPWAVAAFAVGAVGFLLISKKHPAEARPGPSAAPTVDQPSHEGQLPSVEASKPVAEPAKPPSAPGQIEQAPLPPQAVPTGAEPTHGEVSPGASADVRTVPNDPELRHSCVEADADGKGKAKAVAKACGPALEANPKDVDVLLILARVELDRGRLGEVRSLAKRAVAADPSRAEGYVYLGNAEQEAGKHEEARTAYKKYLELAPNGPFAQELRAILSNL
jgi:CheY-like chemotaxis protein/tetratricopeptide (TPR) repeat protein